MPLGEIEAFRIFESGDGAFAGREAGEEFGVLKELGSGRDFPVPEFHEEKGSSPGVADGPGFWSGLKLCDTFEGAKSGDAAAVGLGDRLGGSDADTGSVVAARPGANDDGGEAFVGGEGGENFLQGREEIDLLGSFAGEIGPGLDLSVTGQNERSIRDAGFQNEDPLTAHGMQCAQTVKAAEIKKRNPVAGNPCAATALTVSLLHLIFHSKTILNYHV